MAWRQPGNKPLSEPMMIILLKHICITQPQWVNTTITCENILSILSFMNKNVNMCTLERQNLHTFLVLRPEYCVQITSLILWLLMPWFLVSPGHQRQWYWLYMMCPRLLRGMISNISTLSLLTIDSNQADIYVSSEKFTKSVLCGYQYQNQLMALCCQEPSNYLRLTDH